MAEKRVMGKRTRRLLTLLKILASIVGVWAAYMYMVHIQYHGSLENVSRG